MASKRSVRIILVRHAPTGPSEFGLINRDNFDIGLSSEGRRLAYRLGLMLRKRFKPDIIYTSTAIRAIETAKILYPNNNKITIHSPEFNEINKGFDRWLKNHPGKETMTTQQWELKYNNSIYSHQKNLFHYPSGSSIRSLRRRVIAKFIKITKRHYQNILIVSHNGPIKSIITYVLGNKDDNYFGLSVLPGKYSEIIRTPKSYALLIINNRRLTAYTKHLAKRSLPSQKLH